MKQIQLQEVSEAIDLHRAFYVNPLQDILRILATGKDSSGAVASVQFRRLPKLAANSGDWCVRRLFKAFLVSDEGEEMCLGRPRFIAAQSIVIGNLLSIICSRDADLGRECRAAIGRLFSYEKFCKGKHYVLKRLKGRGSAGVVRYELREFPNVLTKTIGKHKLWCAWTFSHLLRNLPNGKVCVCPYCNRSPLTVLSYDGGGGVEFRRSAIDHFLHEAKYAWLGLSLYNLVPACDLCNSSIKTDENILSDYLSRGIVNPYEDDFDQGLRFTWGNLWSKAFHCDLDENSIEVETVSGRGDLVRGSKGSYGLFKIKPLYEQNCAGALAAIPAKLYKAYSLEPGDTMRLLRCRKSCDLDVEESKRVVFSQSFERGQINSSSLAKVTIDLVDELERPAQRPTGIDIVGG